jgi:5-methyltetrahydrofolate--homocysteine methyltransferase
MDGMSVVGDLFGCGQDVSAAGRQIGPRNEKAVAYLQPFMEARRPRTETASQGKVLMATVKGDVHDIGKNIVGVVLACNNYEVIDLGVMVSCEKILKTRAEQNVDIIGLSGLITPSLDEMQHVAREMQREGFTTPLLIGGATTSRVHTAVKIAPNYEPPVVHVLDASRAVPVVGALVNPDTRANFALKNQGDQLRDRELFESSRVQRKSLTLEQARANRTPIDWATSEIAKPEFTSVRTLKNFPLEQIVPFIDWSPFFHTWELKGVFPRILDDPAVGAQARKLYDDARALLDRIVNRRSLRANAVYGFWPANAVGDDIEVYSDVNRSRVLTVFHTLRQQNEKRAGQYNQALADFVAPRENGRIDYIGGFAETTGIGLEELCAQFERDHDDYSSIMAKALADRLAEAFAELLHKRVRDEWGYGRDENLSYEDMIKERYRGIRPAPGYPSQPDHTEKRLLFDLLQAEQGAGVNLTESFAMTPASSVSGLYLAHPEAKYFALGKIEADQVEDYALRKGMELREVERWLAPNLSYEP